MPTQKTKLADIQYKPSKTMRFLQVTILCLSLLLVIPLLVVESSSLNNTLASNIPRGSSLSTSSNNTSSYWLSPSGNLAFGFYLLPNSSDRYVVGIWLVKSPQKTLVWTANPNDLPLHKQSSILFTSQGKLMLRIMPDNIEKPLMPILQEPAAYAMMHDNGNFVLYGSESQIVWQSFDHPTDTILGGQNIKPRVDLISGGKYKLSVRQTDGLVTIRNMDAITYSLRHGFFSENILKVVSDKIEGSVISPPVTLNLDTSGNLYLVGSDDVVLKYLYRNKNQQQEEESMIKEDVHIYRATLDSIGHFNLYKERIDAINASDDSEKSSSKVVQVLLWSSYKNTETDEAIFNVFLIFMIIIMCFAILGMLCIDCQKRAEYTRARQSSSGDLESGRKKVY